MAGLVREQFPIRSLDIGVFLVSFVILLAGTIPQPLALVFPERRYDLGVEILPQGRAYGGTGILQLTRGRVAAKQQNPIW